MTIDGYCTLGEDREYDLTGSELLRDMDAAGVERAVIAPPDRYLAVLNSEGNQNILRAAHDQRERFIPGCSVNPWYGRQALEEFQRAISDGARMLVLHPLVQGFSANDELIFPLLELAAEAQVPVYVHTGMPGNSTPWQIVDLAERFPSLAIIMGHCGATDFWNDVPDAAAAAPNIYLESSLARPFHFVRYMAAVGKERGIMGSWTPLSNLPFEWEQMRNLAPSDVFEAISGANILRLLTKRGPL